MFQFEELDAKTREYMLLEFRAEEAGNPYRSAVLSPGGREAFPKAMGEAITGGNEETLAQALSNPTFWKPTESRHRKGVPYEASVNPVVAAERLARTEFNTCYVRGFARRMMEEQEKFCQVYRAAPAWEPRAECLTHENQVYPVKDIYEGHRARYWPPPGNPNALSIPVGPNCHHTIRRHRR